MLAGCYGSSLSVCGYGGKKREEAFDCIRLTVAPSEEIAGEMSLHFSTSLNPQWWTATPDPGSDRVSSNHTSVFQGITAHLNHMAGQPGERWRVYLDSLALK